MLIKRFPMSSLASIVIYSSENVIFLHDHDQKMGAILFALPKTPVYPFYTITTPKWCNFRHAHRKKRVGRGRHNPGVQWCRHKENDPHRSLEPTSQATKRRRQIASAQENLNTSHRTTNELIFLRPWICAVIILAQLCFVPNRKMCR